MMQDAANAQNKRASQNARAGLKVLITDAHSFFLFLFVAFFLTAWKYKVKNYDVHTSKL